MTVARIKYGRGYAAGSAGPKVPWSERGTGTGTFNRGNPTPAPAATGLPVDPAYDAAAGNAMRNRSTTLAGIGYQRGQLGQTYGIGTDAAGNVFDDPTNPYSRAAAYQEAYNRSKLGTNTSLAARGQLYTGNYQNQQNENLHVYDRQRDQNIRAFMAAQAGLRQQEAEAKTTYDNAITSAGSDAIMRALANRPDAASVPAYQPPPKPKAVAKTKKKGR